MTSDTARRLAEEHALQAPPSERGAVESAFLAGWEARGEITEEMVEAGAEAIFTAGSGRVPSASDRLTTEWELSFREYARAALSAALGGEGR